MDQSLRAGALQSIKYRDIINDITKNIPKSQEIQSAINEALKTNTTHIRHMDKLLHSITMTLLLSIT